MNESATSRQIYSVPGASDRNRRSMEYFQHSESGAEVPPDVGRRYGGSGAFEWATIAAVRAVVVLATGDIYRYNDCDVRPRRSALCRIFINSSGTMWDRFHQIVTIRPQR